MHCGGLQGIGQGKLQELIYYNKCIATSSFLLLVVMPLLLVAMHLLLRRNPIKYWTLCEGRGHENTVDGELLHDQCDAGQSSPRYHPPIAH